MAIEIKKKLDLLGFQKTLNEQFLEIFESKKREKTTSTVETADLGLGENIDNYYFFFPLKDLKTISNDNKFESIPLTKSWIAGFNQVRGEIFTIIDFKKIIELITSGEVDNSARKINNDSSILYVKVKENNRLGLIINSLTLEYTAEYTKIFTYQANTNILANWKLEENIDIESFFKKENMSEEEWEIISFLKEIVLNKKEFNNETIREILKNGSSSLKILLSIVGDVYLDSLGKRPILLIDMERLTKFLMNVSPF